MPNSHQKIYTAKGSASKHACVDCRAKARDWSRIHGRPEGEPDSYIPRCKSCHLAYDRENMLEHLNRVRPEWTQEQRDRVSRASKGNWEDPDYRAAVTAQWTPERREAWRQATIARNKVPISDERRRRLSESHKGKPSPRKGAKLTDKQKAQISKTLTGRKASEATKAKMAASQRARYVALTAEERKAHTMNANRVRHGGDAK